MVCSVFHNRSEAGGSQAHSQDPSRPEPGTPAYPISASVSLTIRIALFAAGIPA